MKVPKVDRYMMYHLRQRFLNKSRDGDLGTVQAALLSVRQARSLVCGLTY